MFEPQVDFQGNSNFGGDTITASTSRNVVDPNLYDDLVELFPLVQSYLDRDKKKNSTFTRRGSMAYTKTPSKESLSNKLNDLKGRNPQSTITKKQRDLGDKDGSGVSFSVSSAKTMAAEKDKEELKTLRKQVENLQKKLLEKDELLKSAEITKNDISDVHAKLDALKQLIATKDSLIQSTQSELSDAKIKLADRQAALEKTQWEAMTSNQKVEKLQEDLDTIQGEISTLMLLFEGLATSDSSKSADDYEFFPYQMDHIPEIDDLDEMELRQMEEARKTYISAVAAAKESQDEESVAAAASARFHLQSFVFRAENVATKEDLQGCNC